MLDWSPEQIPGWLKIQYTEDESMRVSHETIYRSLFSQARGVLKKELLGHLRSKRRIRRSQHSHVFRDSRGQIVDAISIRERPAEVADRAILSPAPSRLRPGSVPAPSRLRPGSVPGSVPAPSPVPPSLATFFPLRKC